MRVWVTDTRVQKKKLWSRPELHPTSGVVRIRLRARQHNTISCVRFAQRAHNDTTAFSCHRVSRSTTACVDRPERRQNRPDNSTHTHTYRTCAIVRMCAIFGLSGPQRSIRNFFWYFTNCAIAQIRRVNPMHHTQYTTCVCFSRIRPTSERVRPHRQLCTG